MQTKIMTLFTRTPLHVGCGSSVGAVDQPVVRERHTGFPVIPGSAIKGVLADLWNEDFKRSDEGKRYFGEDDNKKPSQAGAISFGEAKLLAFPVRSARGCFAFLTSPLVLERFKRDSGLDLPVPSEPKPMECLAGGAVVFGDKRAVVLEEYRFTCVGEFPAEWAKYLTSLADDAVLNGGEARFVLVSDEDLAFYAKNACQISQHVSIDSQTGTAVEGKLFNQEEVPSETLFYLPIMLLNECLDYGSFIARLNQSPLMQFGGKGTTGVGYCSVKIG